MSKAALKKLLNTMTPEQKDNLILELYSARKEAKAYLEFFLNPDIDKLFDETMSAIAKELIRRGKYGYSKPHITKIRRIIKDFAALKPGDEYVIRLLYTTVRSALEAACLGYQYSEQTQLSLSRFVKDTIDHADKAGMLSVAVENLEAACHIPNTTGAYRLGSFKKLMSTALVSALEEINGRKK